MSGVALDLGFLQIRWYGVMYFIALYLGIFIGQMTVRKGGYSINKHEIWPMAQWAFLFALLGAKVYYAALNVDSFSQIWGEIIPKWYGLEGIKTHGAITSGISGLAIHGGIIGGVLGVFLFSVRYKAKFKELLDIAAPPMILGQAIGRWGNFFNGETHGVPTFTPLSVLFRGNFQEWWATYLKDPLAHSYRKLVPWGVTFPLNTAAGMEFPNFPVHPTMLYESFLNFVAFLLLFFYFRKRKLGRGSLGALYLIMYGIIRIFVSFFRAEDLYIGSFKAPYVVSVLMILGGIILYRIFNRKKDVK